MLGSCTPIFGTNVLGDTTTPLFVQLCKTEGCSKEIEMLNLLLLVPSLGVLEIAILNFKEKFFDEYKMKLQKNLLLKAFIVNFCCLIVLILF